MRSDLVGAASLALVLVGFSGCVGGEAEQAAEPAGVPSAVAFTGGGTGVVDVLVTDDALAPLEGAVVGLAELKAEVSTDAGGRAAFTGVEPGTYTLLVQRLGYESVARRVSVAADETVEVAVRLVPIAVEEAYHLTFIFRGHITCSAGLIAVRLITVCGTTGTPVGNVTVDPNEKNEFKQNGTPALKTVVGEVVWVANAPFAAKALQLNLYQNWRCTPFCSSDHQYGSAGGPSPLVLRSSAPFAGLKQKPATISHFVAVAGSTSDPPFIILVFQQDFNFYSTHFFGAEAPEDFAARPDR